MLINFFGPDYDFIETAFFGPNGLDAVSYGTPTSTRIIATNSETGAVTTITGFGFAFSALGNVIGGTVTGIKYVQGATTVAQLTDFTWNAVSAFNAFASADNGNDAPLEALFNATPVTIDASSSTVPLHDMRDSFPFTTNVTIKGSDFTDTLAGGSGNDTLEFGNGDGSYMRATAGNDTISFADATTGFFSLIYSSTTRAGAINMIIDGAVNTGQVIKADGVDTLVDIHNPLAAGWTTGGLGLYGTRFADTFTISGGAETWMQVSGGEGSDIFNLTMTGWIRLDFNWNGLASATQGVSIDVSKGIVYNDGSGFQDTLNITPGDGVLEIKGTAFADTMIGSSARESFIGRQGDDTINGGGGQDRIGYDRSGVDAVNVDLVAGTATGTWKSVAFTHKLSNIEDIRGSREDNDVLKGNGAANKIQGRGGDDTIIGRGGKDELYGEDGNDKIFGGNGNDALYDGAGDDLVKGGKGNDTFYNGGGEDTFVGGKGRDTFIDGSPDSGEILTVEFNMVTGVHRDIAVIEYRDSISGIENYTMTGQSNTKVTGDNKRNVIKTDTGNDRVIGGGGNDKISTGAGKDVLIGGAGRDRLEGGGGRDILKGGAKKDVLEGGQGNDKLIGGGGRDVFLFRDDANNGNDVIRDFVDGKDIIRVVGGDGSGIGDVSIGATANGKGTIIELDGGTRIVLAKVDVSLIDVDDFQFV